MEFFDENKVRDRFIEIYDRLKNLQIVNNATGFCEKAKINYKSAEHVLCKRRDFQFVWMPNIIKAFKVNPYWFMFGEGEVFATESLQIVDPVMEKAITELKNQVKKLSEENHELLRDYRKVSTKNEELRDQNIEMSEKIAEQSEIIKKLKKP